MQSKRPIVLMGILLVLLLGFVTRSAAMDQLTGAPSAGRSAAADQPAVLPGQNSVSGLKIERDPKGRWMATFDYFYTGEPSGAYVNVEVFSGEGGSDESPVAQQLVGNGRIARGTHRASIEINRPPHSAAAVTTKSLSANMRIGRQTIASEHSRQEIFWPEISVWMAERELAEKGPEALLKRAVAQIDHGSGSSLQEAKRLLERLISKDARYVPAYIELARVAMKTNWGPEGLYQAERLLDSALQIQGDSVNAKILLGYVYAHQRRYPLAEKLTAEAAGAGATNLWVWSNWGEMLAMQGKVEPAIQKYREGLAHPRSDAANDRARLDAYGKLLALLQPRNDIQGMEELYKKRATEFGPGSCFSADYARFVLQQRGDADTAVKLAREAVDGQCQDSAARATLGLAHYAAWAGSTDPQRSESLHQARVFLPAGPNVFYLLAGSERTASVAKQLMSAGETIDQKDNYKLNALAYALKNGEHDTARRLIKLGARTDTAIGEGDIPVALVPVMTADIEGIRMLQSLGVDYAKVRYQGSTALDEARRTGDRRMLDVLESKGRSL